MEVDVFAEIKKNEIKYTCFHVKKWVGGDRENFYGWESQAGGDGCVAG
jgi:hypothetical protein